MVFQVLVHEAEEGGYWAEVPALPGCVSQGETPDELRVNIQDAIEGCLSVSVSTENLPDTDRIIEIAV